MQVGKTFQKQGKGIDQHRRPSCQEVKSVQSLPSGSCAAYHSVALPIKRANTEVSSAEPLQKVPKVSTTTSLDGKQPSFMVSHNCHDNNVSPNSPFLPAFPAAEEAEISSLNSSYCPGYQIFAPCEANCIGNDVSFLDNQTQEMDFSFSENGFDHGYDFVCNALT